jgi:hypothetical protein
MENDEGKSLKTTTTRPTDLTKAFSMPGPSNVQESGKNKRGQGLAIMMPVALYAAGGETKRCSA